MRAPTIDANIWIASPCAERRERLVKRVEKYCMKAFSLPVKASCTCCSCEPQRPKRQRDVLHRNRHMLCTQVVVHVSSFALLQKSTTDGSDPNGTGSVRPYLDACSFGSFPSVLLFQDDSPDVPTPRQIVREKKRLQPSESCLIADQSLGKIRVRDLLKKRRRFL